MKGTILHLFKICYHRQPPPKYQYHSTIVLSSSIIFLSSPPNSKHAVRVHRFLKICIYCWILLHFILLLSETIKHFSFIYILVYLYIELFILPWYPFVPYILYGTRRQDFTFSQSYSVVCANILCVMNV